MKRLVYLLPSLVLSFGVTACEVVPAGTDTDTDGDDDDDASSGDPTTATSPTGATMTAGTETDDPSTTDATAGSSTTEAPPMCTEDDECVEDDDCPTPGAECIACFCSGGTDGECPEWGEGEFGDCVTGGLEACMNPDAGCVVDDPGDPTAGVCFMNCVEPCDCPQPPAGFEAQVACDDVVGDASGMDDCFIDCSGGEDCPDGMYCDGGICFWGEGGPGALGPYDDCINTDEECAEPFCLIDGDPATQGICAPVCDDADDCADPDTGDADPVCQPFGDTSLCVLDCTGGDSCPDGAVCIELDKNLSICTFELEQPGYGDCVNEDEATICLEDEETCYTDDTQSPVEGVCAATDCSDPETDCPPAPQTGDAPRACVDIDAAGGDECVLDCSGDETCPDFMSCGASGYCVHTDFGPCGDSILDRSFEDGTPSTAWMEASSNFGTPLCDPGCWGMVPQNDAHLGEWWVWFGGIDEPEVGSVSQDVTIPATATEISFWLWIQTVTDTNPDLDTMSLLIDGNEEFVATGDDADMYDDYVEVVVDVSGYADDMMHTVELTSSIEGDAVSNFFVDDVLLRCPEPPPE